MVDLRGLEEEEEEEEGKGTLIKPPSSHWVSCGETHCSSVLSVAGGLWQVSVGTVPAPLVGGDDDIM